MNMLWQHIEWHTDKGQRYLRIWVSGKTGGRWLIAKHRAAVALERLSMRQESIGMSLETTIEKKLPQKVFAFDDGSQPYGFEGTFKRLLAAAGLIKDMSSGLTCPVILPFCKGARSRNVMQPWPVSASV